MKFCVYLLIGILNLQISYADAINWKDDCGHGKKGTPELCNKLLSEAFESSVEPNESILKKSYFVKWGLDAPGILTSRDQSLFLSPFAVDCLNEGMAKCISKFQDELDQDLKKNQARKDESVIKKMNNEWAFKIRVEKGDIRYWYHLRQNGNFLIGYIEDLAPKSNRRHFFLIDTSKTTEE